MTDEIIHATAIDLARTIAHKFMGRNELCVVACCGDNTNHPNQNSERDHETP